MEFEDYPNHEVRRDAMNEGQSQQKDLIDTTDCLEAISVFKGWKNIFFIFCLLTLLVLQLCFWLVDTGAVEMEEKTASSQVIAEQPQEQSPSTEAKDINEVVADAMKRVTADVNASTAASAPSPEKKESEGAIHLTIHFRYIARTIRFCNYLLILTAILYCLTILFALKVSLLGKLGGINHISRAFFLSLMMLVFLLPWQRFFPGIVNGAIYLPAELAKSTANKTSFGIWSLVCHYSRFVVHWLFVVILLFMSLVKSIKWSKATLRRLEVI